MDPDRSLSREIRSYPLSVMDRIARERLHSVNFRYMPELSWHLGYPLCLAVIGSLCLYIYWRFKRSGWL
ncbi:hypothetical protein AERYTH_09075 [Aeromicrobium erythreum]|uniref:Magnesium transporter CorA n=2 Tax=Aeromicrobium erythreum TaxID=2041 RepID=A0A0U4CP09_9ACTN|nr:hypothetical protein AERYTH_09075 [Aeromicrobium erythreum]